MIDPNEPGLGIGAFFKSRVPNKAGIATMKRLTFRGTFEQVPHTPSLSSFTAFVPQEYGDILPKAVKIDVPTEKTSIVGTFYDMQLRMPENCAYRSKVRTVSFQELKEFYNRLPAEVSHTMD